MKKTVNINLGGTPFTVDEDAFSRLKSYLNEIEIRLDSSEDSEVMEDIESRIADIFTENISPRAQVVSLTLVNRAISIIGVANEFGEPRRTVQDFENEAGSPKKLYRCRDEKILGGVCGGLSEYFNVDLTLIRVLTFLLIFLGGLSLWVYIVLWIAVPLKPRRIEGFSGTSYKRRG